MFTVFGLPMVVCLLMSRRRRSVNLHLLFPPSHLLPEINLSISSNPPQPPFQILWPINFWSYSLVRIFVVLYFLESSSRFRAQLTDLMSFPVYLKNGDQVKVNGRNSF